MDEREERPERIREEVDPQSEDPQMEEVGEAAREGSLVGRIDSVADHLARHSTADSSARQHEGIDVARPTGAALQETGRGDTLALESDAERRLRPGDELVVTLPADGAADGWGYDVEGDERILDISERATLVAQGAQHRQAPATGRSFQFVIHATARGRATVRFERLRGQGDAVRLRLQVR